MSRRKKLTQIGGQFAWRLVEMLECPAWRVLSLSARRILDRLEIELAHHGGADNGKLPTTYDQFVEYGMDRDCIAPAIQEAIALGFLELTEQGSGGNAEFRRPNRFRLTYRPTDKTDATDEWRQIKTIEAAQGIARASRLKQKTSRGFSVVSVGKIPTENPMAPVRKTPTTVPARKTPTTSISRVGVILPNNELPAFLPDPSKNSGQRAASFIGLCERQLQAGKPVSDTLRASVAFFLSQAEPSSDLHHRALRIIEEHAA